MMKREMEIEQEKNYDEFKLKVFASAFSAFDRQEAMKQYYEVFEEKSEDSYEYEEFIPEDESDVHEMLNQARRLGVIE